VKVLVIDSHKSTSSTNEPQNLHWQNAKKIADAFNADFIWSYKGVNDDIKENYDKIIFVHASHYAFTDYEWIEKSPNANLYYVTNEYNLGEPRTAWMAAKEGRNYTVIANHPQSASKVVGKYVKDWQICNLNALCFDGYKDDPFSVRQNKCVYYGSFRKDREKYFRKYLDCPEVITSTHSKNHEKFCTLGINPAFVNRVNWENGLGGFRFSLYIEDEKTHDNYNYLANRFYESLMWGAIPLFDSSCENTIRKSGYPDLENYVIDSTDDIYKAMLEDSLFIPDEWGDIAETERAEALTRIGEIVYEI
jgi:hypothetical protein